MADVKKIATRESYGNALKALAEEILIEIKNGPPYVYS